MDLRIFAIGTFAALTSGCAGYEAMIIERPDPLVAVGTVAVCERVGVRDDDRRCQYVTHEELRSMLNQLQRSWQQY